MDVNNYIPISIHSKRAQLYCKCSLIPPEFKTVSVIGHNYYHPTENYYTINSEMIVDVNNYIPISTINSQAIDVM